MSYSNVEADPEKIKYLALNLRLCANSLRTDLTILDESLQKLGRTWKDDEYITFRASYRKLQAKIEDLVKSLNASESDLNLDAALLSDYLRTQLID